MTIFNVLQLFGGLALFLYGMSMLGSGLEKTSSGKLEAIIEKMTSNIFKAILVGALVTGTIQSSSATTVIVVGLINARMLKLKQAIGIIMGANIGTTVTAHILRLTDIQPDNVFLNIFKPVNFTPVILVIGVMLVLLSKKPFRRNIGSILIGFGILFTGMFSMESACAPLRSSPFISDLFAKFSNPFLGVLVGMGVTAVVQSSSASVGILQALSTTGALTFSSAFPIIMGQNIGTCITPVLASIGTSKNAKRSAFIHVSFNVIGTLIFLIAIYTIQYTVGFSFWKDSIDKGGIANFHTIFNITVTIILLPFAGKLEKLSKFCIKDKEDETEERDISLVLDDRFLISPGMAIKHAKETADEMAVLAQKNYKRAFSLLFAFDQKIYEKAREAEDTIDRLQSKVEIFLLKAAKKDLTESESLALSEVLQIVNEFERIGDHADNICDCALSMHDSGISFSVQGSRELRILSQALEEIMDLAATGYKNNDPGFVYQIEALEEVIDRLVDTIKARHIERLKQGGCTVEAAFPFIETLSSMERISDYCSNVGVHVLRYHSPREDIDRHEYLRDMQREKNAEYMKQYGAFMKKYYEEATRSGE